jgi:hypothetical protein
LTSQQWGTKLNKIITYIKNYLEPDSKTLQQEAFESAKKYFQGKQKTMEEFQAYQRGYKNAYRSAYAKTKTI